MREGRTEMRRANERGKLLGEVNGGGGGWKTQSDVGKKRAKVARTNKNDSMIKEPATQQKPT